MHNGALSGLQEVNGFFNIILTKNLISSYFGEIAMNILLYMKHVVEVQFDHS